MLANTQLTVLIQTPATNVHALDPKHLEFSSGTRLEKMGKSGENLTYQAKLTMTNWES